jgi:hypothetical protein
MKTNTSLLPLLAAALLPASPVLATVPSTLTLDVKVYYQESFEVEGDLELGDVHCFRVNSKELLALLEDELETDFPVGSKLLVYPDGDVVVIGRDGDFITGVTDYLKAHFDEDSLFDGKYNVDTEQENSHYYFSFGMLFEFPEEDLLLEMRGLAIEHFTGSKPKSDGKQTFKGNIRSNLTGQGKWDGALVFAEGSASLAGKVVEQGM